MQLQTIKDNVYAVLARDWDRRLFDELIPLPEGTSYNAYVVRGSEKTALVDTVDPVMQPPADPDADRGGQDQQQRERNRLRVQHARSDMRAQQCDRPGALYHPLNPDLLGLGRIKSGQVQHRRRPPDS